MLRFDASGNLKNNYGIELSALKAKPEYQNSLNNPAQNYFYPSGDGKSLYWFIAMPKEMACIAGSCADCAKQCWPLKGIDYTSINLETGELSEMKTIGNEKKDPFYLFNTAKPTQMDNYVYFFTEDETEKGKGGNNVRLTRVDISK